MDKSSMRAQPLNVLSLLVALAGLAFGVAAFARTLTTDAASRSATIPYQGFLEQNGTPVGGAQDLTFELFQEEAPGGTAVWSETHPGVMVTAGAFAVELGSITDLPAGALAGSRWLQITVGGVALTGRQLLGSSPFARRGSPGQDFAVDGVLTAQSAQLAGGISAQSAQLTGTISAQAAFGYVPVGTILPWHRDVMGAANPLTLPTGWVACAGGTVNDPDSPINGAAIPDLNSQVYAGGRGRYLRGGTVSGGLNGSTVYTGNGSLYNGIGGGTYYGACYGQFNESEHGTRLTYSTSDNSLGSPYVQVTAMTVIYIMRIK